MTDQFEAAKRRYPSLTQRFDKAGHFLGYCLPLWAPDGKTSCTVQFDREFRAYWSDGWEHIWHWKDRGIFRVIHHGPATYGASTFILDF